MSSLNSKEPGSSPSLKELMDEFDRILVEKGVKFDNLVPVDWDIVEELIREDLSPSPPLPVSPPPVIIPAQSQIPTCHKNSDIRMSTGKDSESSSSDEKLKEEFNLTLREESEDKVDTEEVLRKKLSPSLPSSPLSPLPPVIPNPPQITECLKSPDICMSLEDDSDSESSVSDEKLMEEFDWILSEKDELLEQLDPTDWDIVEDILREDLSPSPPPVIPAPPQIPRCQKNLDIWMSSGKDQNLETSVAVKTLLGELNGTLRDDPDDEVPTDLDSMDDVLRDKLSPSPPLPVSPPPPVITAPSQTARCQENFDIVMSSGNNGDSDSSVSIRTFLEDFNSTLREECENQAPDDWDDIEDVLGGEVSPAPPPSPPPHGLPPPSDVISNVPHFSNNANAVVSQNTDQDYMVRPLPATFTPQAPSSPPPPPPVIPAPSQSGFRRISGNDEDSTRSFSNKELMEDVEWLLPQEKISYFNETPNDWNVEKEFLKEKVVLHPPPPPPPPCQLPSPYMISTNQDYMVRPPPPPPPPPVILAPSQCEVKSSAVNDHNSTTSFPHKELLEDYEWLLSQEKISYFNETPNDWNVEKEFSKEKVVLHPPPPPPPPCQLPSPYTISTNQDYMVWPPPPPPPPVILAPSQSEVRRSSVNCHNSMWSFPNKELSEDVEWLLPEQKQSHSCMAPTDWNVTDDFFRESAVLPPPPSLTSCPPPGIFAPPCFKINKNIVVSQDEVQGNMFRPILQGAPHVPAPPPLVIPAPSGWNSNTIIRPPILAAGGTQSQGQILHSLSSVNLPRNALLQPITVLNGEVLYGVVPSPQPPPPLNLSASKKRKREDEQDDGRPYVKKPPNAFMLFLKEQRPKVMAELNINNSAAVNAIMGDRWRSLPEEQKAKYFDQARVEKKLHEQQHPDWSNMENYGKQKKRVKQNTSQGSSSAYTP